MPGCLQKPSLQGTDQQHQHYNHGPGVPESLILKESHTNTCSLCANSSVGPRFARENRQENPQGNFLYGYEISTKK